MPSITPEQNEQWQRAVMRAYPIPTPDGKECTLEQWQDYRKAENTMLALLPQEERTAFRESKINRPYESVATWNLPNWAIGIRKWCISQNYDYPIAEFIFRSDVALIGMQRRYPTPKVQAAPYLRVLLHFLSGSLRPLVEHAEANQDTELLHDFEGYHQICQLCESEAHYYDQQRWLDIENNFGGLRTTLTHRSRARWLVPSLTRLVRHVLSQNHHPDEAQPAGRLLYLFWDYREFGLPTPGIAQAFLEALEAQCPPPDWLLTIGP